MKNLIKTIYLFILFSSLNVNAQNEKQTDTLIQMKEVIITSSRLQQYTSGNKIQTIDSVVLENNTTNSLSEIISSNSPIHINSYGSGAQSVPSFRGSGSAHTAILWNGFSMQDVLNGEVDFSQIPGFFLDDVKLQFGGCGALYGSGAIGGAINLNDNLAFGKRYRTSFISSFGSFINYFEGVECKINEKEFAGAIRVFNHSIKNDFEYNNIYLPEKPEQKLQNAETKQLGVLVDNSIRINQYQKFNFHLWFQDNDHNIPSIMTDTSKSKQNEKDQFIRRTIEWSRIGRKSEFYLRTGYFNNYKYFTDPAYDIKSDYRSLSSISEFENNYTFNSNFKLNTGINYTHEKGESPNLDNTHFRDRSSIFSSLKYNLKNNRIKTVFSIREEIINSNNTPLTYSFGIDGEAFKGFDIKGNINKSYRIPSFNDLYWNDMVWNMFGNPGLKNEEGFNEELGINYHSTVNKLSFEIGATAFNSDVTNWILWQPVDNFSKWTPMNVDTVWSRGLEYNLAIKYQVNKLLIKFSGMYTNLKTTNESKSADITLKHKQLIYAPEQKFNANIFIEFKDYSLSYYHNYISDRFTNAENSDHVKAYTISDFVVSKGFTYKNYNFNVNFHINNAWNKMYEVMQYYPMPPRNFQFGFRIDFVK